MQKKKEKKKYDVMMFNVNARRFISNRSFYFFPFLYFYQRSFAFAVFFIILFECTK